MFWGVIASMLMGNAILVGLNLPLIGFWASLLKIPYKYLVQIIVVICVIGAYSVNYSAFDVGVMLIFGVFGYLLRKLGFPLAPLVLALILGRRLERRFQQSMVIGMGNLSVLPKVSFWIVFAVFFPAVTGIEAGIAMSGDLKNPAQSLPWGTLFAVITGYIIYMSIPVFLFYNVSGEILRSNPMIMRDVARIGSLIILGVWGATLSSALGALLGAPRTLQALARDRVMPKFLGKGFGPEDTPRIATAFSFIIAFTGIILGDIKLLTISLRCLSTVSIFNIKCLFIGPGLSLSYFQWTSLSDQFQEVGNIFCRKIRKSIPVFRRKIGYRPGGI